MGVGAPRQWRDDAGRCSSYPPDVNTAVPTSERGRWGIQPVDVVAAFVVAVIGIGGSYVANRHHVAVTRSWDAGAVALLAAAAAAILFRRRWPVAVLAVVFAATLAYVVVGYPDGPIWTALIVAFFTAMLSGHRLAAAAWLLAGWVAFSWQKPVLDRGAGPGIGAVFGLFAWLLLLFVAAEVWRTRSARAAEAAQRREEEMHRRANEERVRIAREVHDVVAHNMSLINVQAGTALHMFDEHPEQARAALSTIKNASKQALVELRSVLGVLREVDEHAPRMPTPGADRLDELVAQSQSAGLTVHLVTDGEVHRLPPAVDAAVYRIVQEALTNVTRHATTTEATIRLEFGDRDVVVQIDDDGAGLNHSPATPSGTGNGIAGMKERAVLLGGTLQAGRRPGGGFRVRAYLPLDSVR